MQLSMCETKHGFLCKKNLDNLIPYFTKKCDNELNAPEVYVLNTWFLQLNIWLFCSTGAERFIFYQIQIHLSTTF